MKRSVLVLFVFFILVATPVLGYLPDYQKDKVGDWNVQVKTLSGWEMFIRQLAVSVEDNTYEPGEPVDGTLSGTINAVCSGTGSWGNDECVYGSNAICDGDSVIVCAHVKKNGVVGGDCADATECTSQMPISWSVSLPNDASEGSYDVDAFYKYDNLLADKKDFGSDSFEVQEEEPTTTTTTQPTTTTTTVQCQDYAYKKCYNGNPYWYDSCDNKQELIELCESDEKCVNGACGGTPRPEIPYKLIGLGVAAGIFAFVVYKYR